MIKDKMYGYIGLSNGAKLDLREPDPNMLDIECISGPLSRLCRFSGQCDRFYSVAQHSVVVSDLVPEPYKFIALMHDATEAFCADVPKPIKQLCPDYNDIEDRIWKALCVRYGLPEELPEAVHKADRQAVVMEARLMMKNSNCDSWYPGLEIPEDYPLVPAYPNMAEGLFIDRFNYLSRQAA